MRCSEHPKWVGLPSPTWGAGPDLGCPSASSVLCVVGARSPRAVETGPWGSRGPPPQRLLSLASPPGREPPVGAGTPAAPEHVLFSLAVGAEGPGRPDGSYWETRPHGKSSVGVRVGVRAPPHPCPSVSQLILSTNSVTVTWGGAGPWAGGGAHSGLEAGEPPSSAQAVIRPNSGARSPFLSGSHRSAQLRFRGQDRIRVGADRVASPPRPAPAHSCVRRVRAQGLPVDMTARRPAALP